VYIQSLETVRDVALRERNEINPWVLGTVVVDAKGPGGRRQMKITMKLDLWTFRFGSIAIYSALIKFL
jgi:hypothetical protein